MERPWLIWTGFLQAGERLLTHNYVLVESLALLQHRLGTSSAVKLAESASSFEIIWVDRQLHEEAARRLARAGKRRVSFVDHVSFLVMKSRGIEKEGTGLRSRLFVGRVQPSLSV